MLSSFVTISFIFSVFFLITLVMVSFSSAITLKIRLSTVIMSLVTNTILHEIDADAIENVHFMLFVMKYFGISSSTEQNESHKEILN